MSDESWVGPIFKGKRNVQDGGNDRIVNIMSRAMKLWERLLDH